MRALCDALGSPEAVLSASAAHLATVRGIGPKVAENIVTQRGTLDAAREEEAAAQVGARLVTPLDEEYPAPLKNIYDPPLCLYVRGTLCAKDEQALAVVGTRQASSYGMSQAEHLAFQASQAGFTIVSGLARGIDSTAHRAALKAGGRTLAVLGGALDKLYPPENRELAEEIAANGALISEFPLGRTPDRTTFPYRNRIVSGLCKGVLVVEAGLNSGAMNTAELAMEQGRSVMAVPGRGWSLARAAPPDSKRRGWSRAWRICSRSLNFFPPDEQGPPVAPAGCAPAPDPDRCRGGRGARCGRSRSWMWMH